MDQTGVAIEVTQEAEISLQQALDQIEAAIVDAHGHCDRIQGTAKENADGQAPEVGATHAATRCQASLLTLNGRLDKIATQLGQL